MTKRSKTLAKMRENPRGWRIEELKTLADHFGIAYRQHGTSHVVFVVPGRRAWPVKVEFPLKAVYVTGFLKLVDEVQK